MSDRSEETQRRRTFAIISHPDAGKTTLTEKLLLFGGGIRMAGAVKSNKITKTAASDFMEIEKQRGISVATAVMSLEYRGYRINILDTPGHKDFSEDTYRTLTAVDSVILVIDSVKGVEEQTERLMKVCRMRDTPVMVFINKMDREGRAVLELLDELEEQLNISVSPRTWPIGAGRHFQGVYNLHEGDVHLFSAGKTVIEEERLRIDDLHSPLLDRHLGTAAARLREEVELVEGVYDQFSPEKYRAGTQAPVFFGSALNNFGVRELLETFVTIAPSPRHRPAQSRTVEPDEATFSGFIFKIHANLDPRHRDRIAFLRVCSGVFHRGRPVYHVRHGKEVRFTNPYSFMAEKKMGIDEAFPGDVVGLFDKGDLKIGDTLTEGEEIQFQGIPDFSPAIFKEVINLDPMRSKQFERGIAQLTEEGVAQLFRQEGNRRVVGTVGDLQYEVIAYRMEHEYGAACRFQPLPFTRARWITADNAADLHAFMQYRNRNIFTDKDERPVYLAESEYVLNSNITSHPKVQFHATSEFKLAQ